MVVRVGLLTSLLAFYLLSLMMVSYLKVLPEGVTSNDKSSDETALGEPLSSRTVGVHTGLPMAETLDILRHLWFRGPDCVASAHFAVWRHPEAIAATSIYRST